MQYNSRRRRICESESMLNERVYVSRPTLDRRSSACANRHLSFFELTRTWWVTWPPSAVHYRYDCCCVGQLSPAAPALWSVTSCRISDRCAWAPTGVAARFHVADGIVSGRDQKSVSGVASLPALNGHPTGFCVYCFPPYRIHLTWGILFVWCQQLSTLLDCTSLSHMHVTLWPNK